MPLPAGTRLGPYEIESLAGAGGMGEVYKARDTRLNRTVAIKVLPPHALEEPGARARFEREARTASSLEHPNICALYDVGHEGAVEYLVMPFLEGETLAARLGRGPLPIAEALRYAAEIAGALDRAHRAGILHRDIKPGNVMLARTGRDVSAKLLDFGLAKAAAAVPAEAGVTAAHTVTSPLTGRAAIVGTLAYMSPEQIEGRDVDARSDIFSFGVMLYEMVTGRRPFEAASTGRLIAAILEHDPPPASSATRLTPPALDRVVGKCLQKDRERRWQSAADLADELSWIARPSGAPPASAPARAQRRSAVAAALIMLGAGLVAALAWVLRPGTAPALPSAGTRLLAIDLPDNLRLVRGGIALSPDGRTVVFAAFSVSTGDAEPAAGSGARLYLRRFDSLAAEPIAGTDGARTPFFSPDGQTIGYFTSESLRKVSLRGGSSVRIVNVAPVSRGGVWLPDDTIVMSPMQTSPLMRVSADGKSTPLTTLDTAKGERAHLWPSLLPGGEDVLFAILRGTTQDVNAFDIAVVHVATGERRTVYQGGGFPRYSPTGHLLFVQGGTLSAVPFDLRSRTVRGTAVPIAQGVAVDSGMGAHYDVGPDGTILFLRGAFARRDFSAVWADASGNLSPAAALAGRQVGQPRLSPDGARALYEARTPEGDDEIYLADLARATAVRFSNDREDDFDAVWTPDGRRVIWTALPANHLPLLVMRPADGSGRSEPIASEDGFAQFAGSVSAANVLAYTRATARGVSDIWVVPLGGDRAPRAFIASEAIEYGPEFSPDGKWIAYVSMESGAANVYAAPYPGPGGIRRVTSGGGVSPLWSRDGRTLYYQNESVLMAMSVSGVADIEFGPPRRLLPGSFFVDSREDGPRAYDVAPDGRRFLMLVSAPSHVPPIAFQVLVNWAQQLGK